MEQRQHALIPADHNAAEGDDSVIFLQSTQAPQDDDHVLQNIVHDLKSPLTTINGHAQLLQRRARRDGREADETSATIIINQVRHLIEQLSRLTQN